MLLSYFIGEKVRILSIPTGLTQTPLLCVDRNASLTVTDTHFLSAIVQPEYRFRLWPLLCNRLSASPLLSDSSPARKPPFRQTHVLTLGALLQTRDCPTVPLSSTMDNPCIDSSMERARSGAEVRPSSDHSKRLEADSKPTQNWLSSFGRGPDLLLVPYPSPHDESDLSLSSTDDTCG